MQRHWPIGALVMAVCAGCGTEVASKATAPVQVGSVPATAATSPPPATSASPAPRRLSDVVVIPRREALALAGLPAGGTGAAVRFTDANGRNVVVLSVRGSGRSVRLEADHVLLAAGGAGRVLRQVRDGVVDCDFDVTAAFLPGSLQVADRSSDGLGEVTFAYSTACRSDVSPAALKLLVLQDGTKYILRGQTDMSFAGGPTPGPTTAEPAATRWLPGTYRPATDRFRRYQQTADRPATDRRASSSPPVSSG